MIKKTKKPAAKPARTTKLKAKPPAQLQPLPAGDTPSCGDGHFDARMRRQQQPTYWRVVLTRVLHSGSSEAEARAAFSKLNRDLQHGDKLVLVENSK